MIDLKLAFLSTVCSLRKVTRTLTLPVDTTQPVITQHEHHTYVILHLKQHIQIPQTFQNVISEPYSHCFKKTHSFKLTHL